LEDLEDIEFQAALLESAFRADEPFQWPSCAPHTPIDVDTYEFAQKLFDSQTFGDGCEGLPHTGDLSIDVGATSMDAASVAFQGAVLAAQASRRNPLPVPQAPVSSPFRKDAGLYAFLVPVFALDEGVLSGDYDDDASPIIDIHDDHPYTTASLRDARAAQHRLGTKRRRLFVEEVAVEKSRV